MQLRVVAVVVCALFSLSLVAGEESAGSPKLYATAQVYVGTNKTFWNAALVQVTPTGNGVNATYKTVASALPGSYCDWASVDAKGNILNGFYDVFMSINPVTGQYKNLTYYPVTIIRSFAYPKKNSIILEANSGYDGNITIVWLNLATGNIREVVQNISYVKNSELARTLDPNTGYLWGASTKLFAIDMATGRTVVSKPLSTNVPVFMAWDSKNNRIVTVMRNSRGSASVGYINTNNGSIVVQKSIPISDVSSRNIVTFNSKNRLLLAGAIAGGQKKPLMTVNVDDASMPKNLFFPNDFHVNEYSYVWA